jgi:hypothetical protein
VGASSCLHLIAGARMWRFLVLQWVKPLRTHLGSTSEHNGFGPLLATPGFGCASAAVWACWPSTSRTLPAPDPQVGTDNSNTWKAAELKTNLTIACMPMRVWGAQNSRPALLWPHLYAVAEEEQKVEVQRGIFATLLKPAARGAVLASKTIKRVGSKALAPAAASSEGAHAKAVVPFVPITLVCRDIRQVWRFWIKGDVDHGRAAAGICWQMSLAAKVVKSVPCLCPGKLMPLKHRCVHPPGPYIVAFLHLCPACRYYVNDPSKGTAPGVVQDNSDKEIAGKLELLKVAGGWWEAGREAVCRVRVACRLGRDMLLHGGDLPPNVAAPLRMQGLDLSAEPGSLTALMGGELRAARVLHVCWSRAACTACFNASCCQCKQSKASCPGGTAACHHRLDT